jgi:hypothetical protein
MQNRKPLFFHSRKMNRAELMNFVGNLHNIQLEMIEQAVEKSELKDAKLVLERIMAK